MHDILHSPFELVETKTRKAVDPETGVEQAYGMFTGYASVFNYKDSDSDIIVQGAFTESLISRPNVKMLWQHDQREPIGRYPVIREDAKGLYVEGEICLETERGEGAYALLKQGTLDSLSIGFMTKLAEYNTDSRTRTIKEVDLFEISVVTFSANDRAMINGVKSAFVQRAQTIAELTKRDFERKLRDVFNCTQKEATTIASRGFDALERRDGDSKAELVAFWENVSKALS